MARKVLYPDQLDLFTGDIDRTTWNAGASYDGKVGIYEALRAIDELERVVGVPDFSDSVVQQLAALRATILEGSPFTVVGLKGDKGDKGDTGAVGPPGSGSIDMEIRQATVVLDAGSRVVTFDEPLDTADYFVLAYATNGEFVEITDQDENGFTCTILSNGTTVRYAAVEAGSNLRRASPVLNAGNQVVTFATPLTSKYAWLYVYATNGEFVEVTAQTRDGFTCNILSNGTTIRYCAIDGNAGNAIRQATAIGLDSGASRRVDFDQKLPAATYFLDVQNTNGEFVQIDSQDVSGFNCTVFSDVSTVRYAAILQ